MGGHGWPRGRCGWPTPTPTAGPAGWLLHQVGFASAGHDLVVGTVRPVPGDLTADEMDAWWARHTLTDGHDHVHGANLGFSLAAYRSVGGFRPIPVHEDVELVAALRRAGCSWVAPGGPPVTTSGRRTVPRPRRLRRLPRRPGRLTAGTTGILAP